MIYPTARAVILAAIGAPVALLIGILSPGLWTVALVWIAVIVALLLLDAATGLAFRDVALHVTTPRFAGVGEPVGLAVTIPDGAPLASADAEAALAVDGRLAANGRMTAPLLRQGIDAAATFDAVPSRRGPAPIARVWARWKGPLGLVWKQKSGALDHEVAVVPDVRPVREDGVRLFMRDALHGLMAQLERGEGSEFQSLVEYLPGMDRRGIDWKQSARHNKLFAKEFRTERNNEIVFAVDSGRAMCEPVAGVPRIDRAITAALLTAYVALKVGDRVSLTSFAARPQLASAVMSGASSFGPLQRLASRIDYTHEETNYTLALSSLAGRLDRRSLIVVFTEFTDPTGAELMLRAAGKLLERHVLLFVVMQDAELEAAASKEPENADDVARAVTAAALLRERRIVTTRLRRLGIHVVEAPHDRIGAKLVDSYLSIKKRNLL